MRQRKASFPPPKTTVCSFSKEIFEFDRKLLPAARNCSIRALLIEREPKRNFKFPTLERSVFRSAQVRFEFDCALMV